MLLLTVRLLSAKPDAFAFLFVLKIHALAIYKVPCLRLFEIVLFSVWL